MKHSLPVALIGLLLVGSAMAQQRRPLAPSDMMEFRTMRRPTISPEGDWVAFETGSDAGESSVELHATDASRTISIAAGSQPIFSRDSRWFACRQRQGETPAGVVLWDLAVRQRRYFPRVEEFAFSENSRWLVLRERPFEAGKNKKRRADREESTVGEFVLRLRDLGTGHETTFAAVLDHALAERGNGLLFASTRGEEDEVETELQLVDLDAHELAAVRLDVPAKDVAYTRLTWSRTGAAAAFQSEEKRPHGPPLLRLWVVDGEPRTARSIVHSGQNLRGLFLAPAAPLRFSHDEQRLFFGLREPPPDPDEARRRDAEWARQRGDPEELFRMQRLDAGLDVWHWNDPLIKTHEKQGWRLERDRSYRAVFHRDSGQVVPLADPEVRDVSVPLNARRALGSSPLPYQREVTWDGRYEDVHVVDLASGERRLLRQRDEFGVQLSPEGRFAVHHAAGDWFLHDLDAGTERNLTAALDVPFGDEDHDYPSNAPGYRVSGWTSGDADVVIEDKYDLWQFPTAGGPPRCITGGEGRLRQRIYRVLTLDPDQLAFAADERLLLSAYSDRDKDRGFAEARIGQEGVRELLTGPFLCRFVARAEASGELLFTRESYREPPDLWVAGAALEAPRQVSHLNPQVDEFQWGNARLVEWNSEDGIPLQGVLITPENVPAGEKLPLIVYFYRFFSQRLHEFYTPVINHRPCFPFYAGQGYAIFLPDIRFQVGDPGCSAVRCLVPGVMKLVEDGIVDRDKVALHGHSWSGYQTAFAITQTDLFRCAVAGAPVSNMTSAYGGIRWGSGMARQFQYEKSQSRLGATLWEAPDRYINNSPLFFADRIQTPLLIEFGDVDDAVPWYQGIELYLALRRLDKDCIFLQYRDEPHHLRRFPNKLDYTLKMFEYFEHYLRGRTQAWIEEGVPYQGG